MRLSTGLLTLLVSAATMLQVSGQVLITSTFSFADGDTVAYSATTNALGATTYVSISTITATGTATSTTRSSSSSASKTSAATTTATTTAATTTATTTPRVVGQDSTVSVVSTTFQYTTTNAAGERTVRTSVFVPTFPPTLVPAEPSSGTQYDYSEYISLVGPSISAAVEAASTGTSGAGKTQMSALFGVAGVVLGGLWTFMA